MKTAVITKETDGIVSWVHRHGDKYRVTGVNSQGKRVSLTSGNWDHIRSVNVIKGTRWLLRNNRRHKLQSIPSN